MDLRFNLCSECLAKYQALRFDPEVGYSLCIMPLGSLIWPDEHPDGFLRFVGRGSHIPCQHAVLRLVAARTDLWRTNAVPEAAREFWEEARRVLPEWPGFRRLALNPDQLASLDACAEELDDLMGAIRQDFPDISTTDEGGGLGRFTARRVLPDQE